jgi:flagellar hook-basal body complex protein FliE
VSIGPLGPSLPNRPRLQLEPSGLGPGQLDGAAAPVQQGPAAAADSFGSMLRDAVSQLDSLQKSADANVTRLATGQPVDLHEVMISMEQSNLGLQLAMQVRNKLIEAYQEISRMQV